MITFCIYTTKSIEKRKLLNFYKKDLIRSRSQIFGFTPKTFYCFLSGEKGDKKKLLAYILLGYKDQFILDCKSSGFLLKYEDINYLDENNIETIFDFRKGSVKSWSSKSKLLLKKALINTPESFVYSYVSFFMQEQNSLKFFPSIK